MAHPYHHGDLRRATLDRALQVIEKSGPGHLSFRALAADLGVSHTAPRHHFGSREGLLTAIATEGFGLLAEALSSATGPAHSFVETGVAYLDFAASHRGHFTVMFAPDLLDSADPALAAAKRGTFNVLRAGVDSLVAEGRISVEQAEDAVTAAWSLVHGLAHLFISGSLAESGVASQLARGTLSDLARRSAGMLYGSTPPAP